MHMEVIGVNPLFIVGTNQWGIKATSFVVSNHCVSFLMGLLKYYEYERVNTLFLKWSLLLLILDLNIF